MQMLSELLRNYFEECPSGVAQIQAIVSARAEFPGVLDDLLEKATQRAREEGTEWTDIGLALSSRSQTSRHTTPVRPGSRVQIGEREHTGKYRPLWSWLVERNADEVTLSFSDVERILGFQLPPSSREHVPHWHGYKGSAVARAIIDAGFRSRNVDLGSERVTFVRHATN